MNQEKAREFFSNYYEGTLEPGLAQALEQAMARDNSLRDEYQDFENSYEELGTLKFETIQIPFDLNDRILANIDKHIFENRRSQQPAWTMWLRNLAIGSVCAVAILGAVLSLRSFNSRATGAGVVTAGGTTKDEITVEPNSNRDATITFAPNTTQTLVISEGLSGPVRRRTTVLEGKGLTTTLENPSTEATVFHVKVSSDPRATLIALPGSEPTAAKIGQGNLADFAKALAGYYRVPVEVHVSAPTVNVSWEFKSLDAQQAAIGTLDLQRYTILRGDNNMIVISES